MTFEETIASLVKYGIDPELARYFVLEVDRFVYETTIGELDEAAGFENPWRQKR